LNIFKNKTTMPHQNK